MYFYKISKHYNVKFLKTFSKLSENGRFLEPTATFIGVNVKRNKTMKKHQDVSSSINKAGEFVRKESSFRNQVEGKHYNLFSTNLWQNGQWEFDFNALEKHAHNTNVEVCDTST